MLHVLITVQSSALIDIGSLASTGRVDKCVCLYML